MSLTGGLGEHWGSYIINTTGLNLLKRIIKEIKERIEAKVREFFFPQYYDATFKVPVEKLSVIKERSKIIDVSQLIFEKEPLLSYDDFRKCLLRSKKRNI